MNSNPLDERLLDLDIDDDKYGFQCGTKGPAIYERYREIMQELIDWSNSFQFELYDQIYRNSGDGIDVFKGELIRIQFEDEKPGSGSLTEWRMVWRDFVISWYKHPLRCLTVNRLLTEEEQHQFLIEFKEELMPYAKFYTRDGIEPWKQPKEPKYVHPKV